MCVVELFTLVSCKVGCQPTRSPSIRIRDSAIGIWATQDVGEGFCSDGVFDENKASAIAGDIAILHRFMHDVCGVQQEVNCGGQKCNKNMDGWCDGAT